MARDEAYRKAERKIEAARRLNAKELQLSALPGWLSQLTELQKLDLSSN
jgi:hypothetical protein